MGLLSENSVAGFDPYPDGDKTDMSAMAPEGITDLGQLGTSVAGGLLSFGTRTAVSAADRALGAQGFFSGGLQAGAKYGKTGNPMDAIEALAPATVSAISKSLGISSSLAVDGIMGAARGIRAGMDPTDAALGSFGKAGLKGISSLLGAAIAGPFGAVLGSLAAGYLSESDFGKAAAREASIGVAKASQAVGIFDDDFESWSELEDSMGYTGRVGAFGAIDAYGDLADTYGAEHGWGAGGWGAAAHADADNTDSRTGTSMGHGGLQGHGLLGTDADAAENEGYGPGHFGGGGGEADSDSGGMGIGDADGGDAGGGEGIY